jgi:two-component system, NarL family, nitrate/nitrite response regulator NarL
MSAVHLTRVERHIVICLLEACTNREIAARRGTSEQVIKNALSGIYDKTGMSTRLELALAAMVHPEWLEE